MDTASHESADMMRFTYRGAKMRDNESSMVTMRFRASSQKDVLPLWLQSRTLWDSVGQVTTSGNLGRVSSREVQAYLLPPWARAPTPWARAPPQLGSGHDERSAEARWEISYPGNTDPQSSHISTKC